MHIDLTVAPIADGLTQACIFGSRKLGRIVFMAMMTLEICNLFVAIQLQRATFGNFLIHAPKRSLQVLILGHHL